VAESQAEMSSLRGASPAAAATRGPTRRAYLDKLKVVLVVGVIVGHAFITYGDVGSWAYQEPSSNEAFRIVAALGVALGSLFVMGLFFLIAGLLTPRALARKGPADFLQDRSLRLGLPFLAYLFVYPVVDWWGERSDISLREYMGGHFLRLDPGPLWFVLVLLIYSAGYVAWRAVRPVDPQPRALRIAFLVELALLIAVGTVLVRLWFPINSNQVFALHLWQWPQCIGLFVLGISCGENGWLDPVGDSLRRSAGVLATTAMIVVIAAFAVSKDSLDPFAGGLAWQALLTATCEAVIAVALSIWLLGHFQRRHDHVGRLGKAMGRAAFGAYVLQAPVLVVIAVSASALAVAPEVKFFAVASAAVAGSFGLAWLLTRLPLVNRVL